MCCLYVHHSGNEDGQSCRGNSGLSSCWAVSDVVAQKIQYSLYVGVSAVSNLIRCVFIVCLQSHHEGHSDECAAVPPLCSGGGPLSDCSLCQLHGY